MVLGIIKVCIINNKLQVYYLKTRNTTKYVCSSLHVVLIASSVVNDVAAVYFVSSVFVFPEALDFSSNGV